MSLVVVCAVSVVCVLDCVGDVSFCVVTESESKKLAAEVLDLLKSVAGVQAFSSAYTAVTTRLAEKRSQRKQQKAAQVKRRARTCMSTVLERRARTCTSTVCRASTCTSTACQLSV